MESRWAFLTTPEALAWTRECEFAADLLRAQRSLELSRELSGSADERDREISDLLLDASVQQYWLVFAKSDTREPLGFDIVPEHLRTRHEGVRRYRNRTLAHSNDGMVSSAVIATIDRSDGVLTSRPLISGVVRITPPEQFSENLVELISVVLATVDERAETARIAAEAALERQLAELWATGTPLERDPFAP